MRPYVVGKSLELVLGQRLDGSCVATDNTKVMLFVQVNVVLNRQIDGNLKQKRPAARTNAMWLGGGRGMKTVTRMWQHSP